MTKQKAIPEWAQKQAAKNPNGFLADLLATDGAGSRSQRPASRLELWVALDVLKAHALSLQARIDKLEQQGENQKWVGVWNAEREYRAGNFLTFDGSLWVATVDSKGVRPGDGTVFRLVAKRGRDGKDVR